MQDKTELTFLFEQSDDDTEFVLTLKSEDPMTDEEYLIALQDFIETYKKNEQEIEFNNTTSNIN